MAVLPRPPSSRSLDPLDPEKILEDARALPRFHARNVRNLATGLSTGTISPEQGRDIVSDIQDVQSGNVPPVPTSPPVATPETATQPIAPFDTRTPEDRAREQNEFRDKFSRPAQFELPSPEAAAKRAAFAAQVNGTRVAPQVQGPAQRALTQAIQGKRRSHNESFHCYGGGNIYVRAGF